MDSKAQVNPLLTEVARTFAEEQDGLVGMDLAPVFSSSRKSGDYYKFEAGHFLDQPNEKDLVRAPGSEYKRVTSQVAGDGFNTTQRGVEEPVDDVERALYSNEFDADQAVVEARTLNILRSHEIRVRDASKDASVPNSATGVTGPWDNTKGAEIKQELDDTKETIRKACGSEPNLIIIPSAVWTASFENNAYFLDLIKYTQTGQLTVDLMSSMLGMRIRVAKGLVATNNDGAATTSDNIWTDDEVVLAHSNGGGLRSLSFMRTFEWDDMGMGAGVVIKSYREDKIDSDIHRASSFDDIKHVAPSAGYRITGVLS